MEIMEPTMYVWLGLVLGLLPLFWWLLSQWNEILYVRHHEAGGARLPPGHMGIPLLGEWLTFLWYFNVLRRPDDFINSKRRKYGVDVGLYKTYLFGSPAIIVSSPSANKFVFTSEDKFRLVWPTLEIFGTKSLAALQGQEHARIRRFIANATNTPDALRRITLLVQPRLIAALQSWAEMGTISGRKETKKVTMENIGKMFLSVEPGPLLDIIDKMFIGITNGMRAIPLNFPGTAYRHALKCRKRLGVIFKAEIEKRRTQESETAKDLMDGLTQITDEEGNKLDDAEVIDNIVSLVTAGYESTSIALMWSLFYLAKYPNVLKKLREENMVISQSKRGEYLTSEDITKLKYTNKVVEESIRMANIAALLFRTAIDDVEYNGYKIPKGWRMICWIRYLHTNPENFDDPMCFNPDRWDEPAKPGTYRVFGGGSRTCAGNMLARMQIAIFLHHLSVGYKWEVLNPDAKIVYLPHPYPEDKLQLSFSKI